MQLTDALTFGLAGMFLHEIAHMAAAIALKVKIHQIGVNWRGPYIRREFGTLNQNIIITLSGPGVNLWLAWMFHRVCPSFALCNLVLGVSNLLPTSASDGTRAVRLISKAVLARLMSTDMHNRATNTCQETMRKEASGASVSAIISC